MSNPNKRIKLSFEDEEEDEVTIFSKKKANSKPTKRIFQAPVIEDSHVSNLTSTDTKRDIPEKAVSAPIEAAKTSYSKADLEALRTAQNFKITNSQHSYENETMDVVELSGDQADALEEQLYGKQSKHLGGSDEMKQYEALIAEKKQQKSNLRNKQGNSSDERIYTSNLVPKHENRRVAFDDTLDLEPAEWEEEIIQRGVLLPSAQPREEELSAARLGFATSKNNKNSSTHVNDVMIMDLVQQVQTSIDQLQFNLEEYDRKSNQLATEVRIAENKAQEQERIAEENFKRLHAIEEAKRFFPNVIGMLREKEPYLEELLTVWRNCLQRQHDQRHSSLANYQEDIMYRLQQANELQSMDSRYRLSPNSICQKSTETETDAFGREKPLAIVYNKAYFTKPEVITARGDKLTKALQTHIYLSELDTISNEALSKQRWEIIAQMHFEDNAKFNNNNIASLYLDALLHCLQPLDWEMKWQQDVSQVEAAMQTLMADVAYEVSSVKEILRYAAHVRSHVTDAYYQAYIPLSIGQVLPFLIILEVLPHTHLFYHPREVLGTHDLREEILEMQQGTMSSWRWVHIMKDFLRSSPTHVVTSQSNSKSIVSVPTDTTTNKSAVVTRHAFLRDVCVEDDHIIVQQLLDNDGLLWTTYFSSFFTYALDLSCPRSCQHAERHVCATLFNVFLPEITSLVVDNTDTSKTTANLGSWGVCIQSVQERISSLLCERLTAQCLEIALPVCHVNDKLYSMIPAIEAAVHNPNSQMDVPKSVSIMAGDKETSSSLSSAVIDNNATSHFDENRSVVKSNPSDTAVGNNNSKEQPAAGGASNFKGGRMMFVSASSAYSSTSVSTSSSNPAASHASSTSSHHRMGLGYSSATESAKNTISMNELLEGDVGLGVSFMSMQVLHITQILRHFHEYFLSPYVLFLPNRDDITNSGVHHSMMKKRAMRVRQVLQTCLWQRMEPVLRKLARVSLYPILDIVFNRFLTRFVSILAVLMPWSAEQGGVNVVAWQRCQQSMEDMHPLVTALSEKKHSGSRQWREIGDMLILLVDDLSSVML